ncbi:cytochrome P450 [Wolfiporia cocos MD-104 SS10]|uniref:Cytochrome P450 n=1 Tax=Wolfiporia cocos (strain MD-104) TaxID=742152 RepID=A0A2H3JL26_WOLCO|nr:cytochrome P450 [Wolfiporia cocos MD-104 SS10]
MIRAGNYSRIFQDGWDYNLDIVKRYGGAVKITALLGEQQLYISDPRALYNILVKEQDIYEETEMFIMGNQMVFGEGLISTLDLREIDIVPWTSRSALECVSQEGLGHTFNALDMHNTNEYVDAILRLALTALRIIMLRPFVPFVVQNLSLYWRQKLVDWLPIRPLKDLRKIVEIMDKTARRILAEKKARQRELNQSNDGLSDDPPRNGQDIISVLLKANSTSLEDESLTDSEILGQINTLMFAGLETTAIAIARILYILASNSAVQSRLRDEIHKAMRANTLDNDSAQQDVKLPYDILMAPPYMDAVIRETLRVYRPTSLLSRTTKKATTLPLQCPVRLASGETAYSIPVPENTMVIISILAANHNKDVWGLDASEWRPEHWLTPSGERIHFNGDTDNPVTDGKSKSSTFYSTGMYGNQAAIKYPGVSFKFAELEIKQTLAMLLSALHFELPNDKEIHWKMNGLQVPVVCPPTEDDVRAQVPLMIRHLRQGE